MAASPYRNTRRPGPVGVRSAILMGLLLIAQAATAQELRQAPTVAPGPGAGRQDDGSLPPPPDPLADDPRDPLGRPSATGAPAAVDRGAPDLLPPADPGLKYRFIEQYQPPDSQSRSGIGAYRVAFTEWRTNTTEVARAAPQSNHLMIWAKYVARPAIIAGLEREQVQAMVREYETIVAKVDDRADPDPYGLAGLAGRRLWFGETGAPTLEVISLDEKPLTQPQFSFVSGEQISVPSLAELLPRLHLAVGDEWNVPRAVIQSVMGSAVYDGELIGRLERVDAPTAGQETSNAILSLTGRVGLANSVAYINAELTFQFTPEQVGEEAPLEGRPPGEAHFFDAPGAIVMLRLAERQVASRLDEDGRPSRESQIRQVLLERRLDLEGTPVPSLPATMPPEVTPENSWIDYRDPDGRFRFRYPQDFLPGPLDPGEAGAVHLVRGRVGSSPDDLYVEFEPGSRVSFDEFARAETEGWRSRGVEVMAGAENVLPEADWPGRRVYRLELPLRFDTEIIGDSNGGDVYYVAYLMQFSRDVVFLLRAATQGDRAVFRNEVEQILRTVELDPEAPATAVRPSPAAPAAIPGTAAPAGSSTP